jgi:hypothetical protein
MIEAASDPGATQVVAPHEGTSTTRCAEATRARSRVSSTSITRASAASPASTSPIARLPDEIHSRDVEGCSTEEAGP